MASDASKEAAALVFLKDNHSGPSVNPLLSAQALLYCVYPLSLKHHYVAFFTLKLQFENNFLWFNDL